MDEVKKNGEYLCQIEGVTGEGLGVARIGGRAVFVRDALPGERCRVQVLRLGSPAYARVLHRENTSPHRVAPDCPYYGKCGGCDWRHADYAGELEWKLQRANDAFQRLGGLSLRAETILPAPDVARYRAKAIFAVGQDRAGKPVTGFYRQRSHEIIPVEDCALQTREANTAARVLREWMETCRIPAYEEGPKRGLVRHLFVRSGMVCVVAAGAPRQGDALVRQLRAALPELRSVIWNRNHSEGNTVLSGSFETLWGTDTVEVQLSGLSFRLSPRSFFQVNPAQAQRLYALAVEQAALTGREKVIDLYCGTGAIGLLAAGRAASVLGVEVIPAAVADAGETAARNGIQNAEFLCADASEAAEKLAGSGERPDVLFVDPPRKGLDPVGIAAIAAMQPERVVYVSCDPGTLARDLQRFTQQGYTPQTATAVDMFPRTRHVETVVLLSRGTYPQSIEVKIDVADDEVTGQPTYKRIKEYVKENYGFNVHTAYIAEVKRMCGLDMHKAPNAVEQRKHEYHPCPVEKVEAIKNALRHFGMIE